MNRTQAQAYYKNRQFYQILRESNGDLRLIGPLNDVRKTSLKGFFKSTLQSRYAFCQVTNGQITTAFTKEEILTYKGNPL